MRRGIALSVLAVLAFGAACSRSPSAVAARLQPEGEVEVAEIGEEWHLVRGSQGLSAGEQVRVRQGSAVITLSDDRGLELREGSHVTLDVGRDSKLLVDLEAGELLVTASTEPVVVTSTDVSVGVGLGAARVSRGDSTVVRSYSATVDVDSAGRLMTVPPLRQVSVPAFGVLPSSLSPLGYSPTDSWDQRFLGEALQLGRELEARSQGFTAQLRPGEGRTVEYYRALLPALAAEPSFAPASFTPSRSAGETLVGLAIALGAPQPSFSEHWASVTAFRDQGADWGLVALDQGAQRGPLLDTIDTAIGLRAAALTPAPAPAPPSPPGASTQVTAPAPSSASSSSSSTAQAAPAPATPAPTPTNTRGSGAAGGSVQTGIAPVDDTANSLISLLGGLLNSL